MTKFLGVFFAALLAVEVTVLPAAAMSTAQEVEAGRAQSAQIDAQSLKVADPFLVSWVNSVGGRLAQYRKRHDIDYHFTILADPDINAFAVKGGFIHVNLGLLNFVSSDDELASTLGHEMGHVELRHVVKSSNQGTIIGILTAIASILSPVAMVLGGIGGELVSDKFSRVDELQADKYGLGLMSEAGYDPQAAVDVMAKLGAMDPGPESKADKAFIDHPVPTDRVSHLLGYPELDRPSVALQTARAIHNESEGRYSYASAKLKQLALHGSSPTVDQHISQLDFALRESGALAAPDGRVTFALTSASDARRIAAADALRLEQANARTAASEAKTAARAGLYELDDLEQHINKFASGLQAPQPMPQTVNSGGTGAPQSRLMSDITGTLNFANDVLTTAPGLIEPNSEALREMSEPLGDAAPLTPKYQALFAYYPALTSGLGASTRQLIDSIRLSRAAIAAGLEAAQATQGALAPPSAPQQNRGGETPKPTPPNLGPAIAAWDAALALAQRASDEMYAAQTSGLSAEITLLDVLSSPQRYAAFRQALIYRFPGVAPPSYAQASRLGIAPGEIACASWLAFDTHASAQDVLSMMKSSAKSCEDVALSRHLMGESMEIAEGLIYEAYVDGPQPSR